MSTIPFILIGPTAGGKTALSIKLAQAYNYEIWSLDSRQCYKGLTIGTAAPTPAELKKVTHHNIGILKPDEKESVAFFLRRLNQQFPNWKSPSDNEKPLLFVGGSTLNAQALIYGIDEMPSANAENIKQLNELLAHEGEEALLQKLRKVDPLYASKMEGFNRQRCLRALDIWMQTGKAFSSFHSHDFTKNPSLFPVFGLNPDRVDLYNRINNRVEEMWENGLVDECKAILQQGYSENCHGLEGVGYREVIQVLKGELSEEKAKEQMKTRSRRYAKRQLTWFKRWNFIEWYKDVEEAFTKISQKVEELNNK